MSGFAFLIIYIAEMYFVVRLSDKYTRPGETMLTPEEFMTRATFDDVIRMRFHVVNSWAMLGLMSIRSLVHL